MLDLVTAFLFIGFLSLLLYLAMRHKNAYLTILAGVVSLFIALSLYNGGLTYKSGMNKTLCPEYQTYIYGSNYTAEHLDYNNVPPGQPPLNLFHLNKTYAGCAEISTDTYSKVNLGFSSVYIGHFFALLFLFLLIIGVITLVGKEI